MKLLLFDNYDSFTYNIAHAMRQLGVSPDVIRNDKIKLEDVQAYDKIIISPGPGIPEEAGLLMDLLNRYATSKPILGVCLGHQAIGQHFGAKLINLDNVYHGVQTDISIVDDDYIFDGLSRTLPVGRYHSWVVDADDMPSELVVTALSKEGDIMALKHRDLDVHGVQFHPESILTPDGLKMLDNWLKH